MADFLKNPWFRFYVFCDCKGCHTDGIADAEMCQDAVHWAFQKSYKQLGRPYDDWNELEIQDIISWQSKPFI